MSSLSSIRRCSFLFIGFIVLALFVAGCGDDDDDNDPVPTDPPATEPGRATESPATDEPEPTGLSLTDVSFRFSFTPVTSDAPVWLAKEAGYFEEEGLNVSFGHGTGSTTVVQLIANGRDDFSIINRASMIRQIATSGLPVQSVAGLMARNPSCIASRASDPVTEPSDLIGKQVGVPPGGTQQIMVNALLESEGLADQVEVVGIQAGNANTLFISGQLDTIATNANDAYLLLKEEVGDDVAPCMLVSDFGINLAQDGLVTTIDMINDHPDTVRAMTRAILRGYAHAIDNPQDAVDALFKNNADLEEITTNESALESVIATVELAQSPATEENGLGYQSDDEFMQSEEILIEVEDISRGAPELSFYYTNEFLPDEPIQPDSY